MDALNMVNLTALMERTCGHPDVRVALIDGPVASDINAFAGGSVEVLAEAGAPANDMARLHGTFVAGILWARPGFGAPAICPGCTLLLRPIFTGGDSPSAQLPRAAPELLAAAILDCIEARARVINLSLALSYPSMLGEASLEEALDHALRQQVIVVAAAGNQSTLGSTAITRHPWVVPVVACDTAGRPTQESNLGRSIARSGLRAPGERITSIGADGQLLTLGGTSIAAPFVAGAAALLWSAFPAATAAHVRSAMIGTAQGSRGAVVPPLLDADAAYRALLRLHGGSRRAAPGSVRPLARLEGQVLG